MDKDLHILQHSLGVDDYGRGKQYRNYFAASVGSSNFVACCRLQAKRLMAYRESDVSTLAYFYVTELGKKFVAENSPAPQKLTRGQKRYQDFLDADSGMKFGEWLRYQHDNQYHA